MSKEIEELAKLLKERENKYWMGVVVGEVESPPPELRVRIDEKIIINRDKIVVSWEKVAGYNREYSIDGKVDKIDITFNEFSINSIDKDSNGDAHGTVSSTNGIFKGSGTYKASGRIEWTDELKKGDLVIMLPTVTHGLWYLVDKVYKYQEVVGE